MRAAMCPATCTYISRSGSGLNGGTVMRTNVEAVPARCPRRKAAHDHARGTLTELGPCALRPATPADSEFCFQLHKAAMGG
ncbi:MAG TPA: hypothetical protein VMU94_09300 [Streptosporangiaceae bacterium]|nr:hypothetical protein [Streptosporangiaceae bacterium]